MLALVSPAKTLDYQTALPTDAVYTTQIAATFPRIDRS